MLSHPPVGELVDSPLVIYWTAPPLHYPMRGYRTVVMTIRPAWRSIQQQQEKYVTKSLFQFNSWGLWLYKCVHVTFTSCSVALFYM